MEVTKGLQLLAKVIGHVTVTVVGCRNYLASVS